jgi:hypothetical protein
LQELAVLLIGVDEKGKVVVYSGVPEAVQNQGLVSLDWLRAALQPVGGKGGGKGALVTGQVRCPVSVKKIKQRECVPSLSVCALHIFGMSAGFLCLSACFLGCSGGLLVGVLIFDAKLGFVQGTNVAGIGEAVAVATRFAEEKLAK